jgi:DNA-binding response OmpR family regulator
MAHILVVDDDRDLRGLVDFRLRRAGHQVLSARDAESALALVTERGAPDLAILDIMLPGMSGLALLVELRKRNGLEQLPAIFLSARILPSDIAAGRDLGATYLTKPFVAPALMAAVTGALGPADKWAAPATPAPAQLDPPPAPTLPRSLTSRPPPGY